MCLPRSVNLLKLQSFFINPYTEKVDSCSYGQIWNMGITLMELVRVPPKKREARGVLYLNNSHCIRFKIDLGEDQITKPSLLP